MVVKASTQIGALVSKNAKIHRRTACCPCFPCCTPCCNTFCMQLACPIILGLLITALPYTILKFTLKKKEFTALTAPPKIGKPLVHDDNPKWRHENGSVVFPRARFSYGPFDFLDTLGDVPEEELKDSHGDELRASSMAHISSLSELFGSGAYTSYQTEYGEAPVAGCVCQSLGVVMPKDAQDDFYRFFGKARSEEAEAIVKYILDPPRRRLEDEEKQGGRFNQSTGSTAGLITDKARVAADAKEKTRRFRAGKEGNILLDILFKVGSSLIGGEEHNEHQKRFERLMLAIRKKMLGEGTEQHSRRLQGLDEYWDDDTKEMCEKDPFCKCSRQWSSLASGGYLAGINSSRDSRLSEEVDSLLPDVKFFSKESEMNAWVKRPDYGSQYKELLCGALIFENDPLTAPLPKVTVRVNATRYLGPTFLAGAGFGDPTTTAFTKKLTRARFAMKELQHNRFFEWYSGTHFLGMQHVAQMFLGYARGATQEGLHTDPVFHLFPTMPERVWLYGTFAVHIAGNSVVQCLMFGPLVASSAYFIARERQTRSRELMRMMGLMDSALTFSWLVLFIGSNLVISAILALSFCIFVFQSTSAIVLWLALFAFANASVALGLMVAALVTTDLYAALTALAVFFVSTFVGSAVDEDSSRRVLLAVSMLPPVGFHQILDTLLDWERLGLENNVWTMGHKWNGTFSAGDGIFMLFSSFALLMVLSYYLDQVVWWHGVGVPRPLWFFLQPSYWSERLGKALTAIPGVEEEEAVVVHEHREAEEEGHLRQMRASGQCVTVTGLSKTFTDTRGDTVHAVRNVSFTMYQDECFCLLGHNGAGKTTTMMMITGCLPQTRGKIHIRGHSIPEDIRNVRSSMGFCPQHNILWDELTCLEHLHVFGRINGMEKERVKEKGEELLRAVALLDKINERVRALSGGMKRKLSCTLAFLHEPFLVILDEPSAGMDPFARRGMWDTLKLWRVGHIFCLTTHYMDEADALADRLAIMHAGEVACSGTSLFLKKAFGCGYIISFVKLQDGGGVDEHIFNFLKQHLNGVQIQSSIGKELLVSVPFTEANKFPEVFQKLDERREVLGLESYGMSITNLEEVFLKVASDHGKGHPALSPVNGAAAARARAAAASGSSPLVELEAGLLPKELCRAGFFLQLYALFVRRLKFTVRNTKAICCQVCFPMACLSLFCLFTAMTFTASFSKILLDTSAWNLEVASGPQVPVTVGWHTLAPKHPQDPEEAAAWSTFASDGSRDIHRDIGFDWVSTGSSGWPPHLDPPRHNRWSTPKSMEWHPVNATAYPAYHWETSEFMSRLWESRKGTIAASRYGAVYYPHHGFDQPIRPVIFHNRTAVHAAPVVFKLHAEVHLKNATKDKEHPIHGVELYNHPFPPGPEEKGFVLQASGILLAMTVMIAYGFIPAGTGSFIVMEKETEVKNMLLISGCRYSAYWLSNLVFDSLFALVPGFGSIFIFWLLEDHGGKVFVTSPGLGATIGLVVAFGPAMAAFSYVSSFFFSRAGIAMFAVWLFNCVFGLIAVITLKALASIPYKSTHIKVAVGRWFCRLIPVYTLGSGFFSISLREKEDKKLSPLSGYELTIFGKPDCGDNDKLEWYEKEAECSAMVGDEFISMLLASLFLMLIVLLTDFLSNMPVLRRGGGASVIDKHLAATSGQQLDRMVQSENDRVASLDSSTQFVYVKNVHKVYGRRVHAVRGISFAASEGQVFGLLGVNGAGKTTTFKILCSEIAPSSGDVRIQGHDVTLDASEARKYIGYCPQFNALLESMTAVEHLYLFGRMKGLVGSRCRDAVETILTDLDLRAMVNTRAGQLSGGNKRKVNVGMATIGEPPMVFLDEPSAGMDPVARRGMWSVIQDIAEKRKKSVVILTTHSMEEAEALCSRIAIQVDGQFRCLGSAQQLKSHYGLGLELNVRLATPTHQEIATGLQQLGMSPTVEVEVRVAQQTVLNVFGQRVFEEVSLRAGSPLTAGVAPLISPAVLVEWSILAYRCLQLEDFMTSVFAQELNGSNDGQPMVVPLEKAQNVVRYQIKPTVLQGRFRSIGSLFALFQSNKETLQIEDFQVNQTSLEQIFNHFASTQASQEVMGFNRASSWDGTASQQAAQPSTAQQPPDAGVQLPLLNGVS